MCVSKAGVTPGEHDVIDIRRHDEAAVSGGHEIVDCVDRLSERHAVEGHGADGEARVLHARLLSKSRANPREP